MSCPRSLLKGHKQLADTKEDWAAQAAQAFFGLLTVFHRALKVGDLWHCAGLEEGCIAMSGRCQLSLAGSPPVPSYATRVT